MFLNHRYRTPVKPPGNTGGSGILYIAIQTSFEKQALALKNTTPASSKWLRVSLMTVMLAGLVILLPWKITPRIHIGVTHYRNYTYDYSNIINSMFIYVEIPRNDINIKKLDIIIDNRKTEELSNSDGVYSGYSSSLSFRSPVKPKNPKKVKFLVRTNAGDFQENLIVDLGRNYTNLEEFFLTF